MKVSKLKLLYVSFGILLFIFTDIMAKDKTSKEKKKKESAVYLEDSTPEGTQEVETEKGSNSEEPMLKNSELIDSYIYTSKFRYSHGEHLLINMFSGAISGAIYGALIGFSDFDVDAEKDQYDNVLLFTGIIGGAGLLSGVAIFFIEYFQEEQFNIGKSIWAYSTYGTITGGILGGLFGFIPFASSNDYSDVVNYIGYGSAAGLGVGIILYFFLELWVKDDQFKLDVGFDPSVNNWQVKTQYLF